MTSVEKLNDQLDERNSTEDLKQDYNESSMAVYDEHAVTLGFRKRANANFDKERKEAKKNCSECCCYYLFNSCWPCFKCFDSCFDTFCDPCLDCCLGCGNYCSGAFEWDDLSSFTRQGNLQDFLEDAKSFETGDILLLASDHAWYTQIITNSRWMHVAMVYKTETEWETIDGELKSPVLTRKDRFLGDNQPEDGVLVFETTFGPKNRIGKGADLKHIGHWAKTYLNRKGYYIGHRKLYKNLDTDEGKKLWRESRKCMKKSFEEVKDKQWGGINKDDMTVIAHILNLQNCCYYVLAAAKFCAADGCFSCCCHTTGENLKNVFCSELVAKMYAPLRDDDDKIYKGDKVVEEGRCDDHFFPGDFGDETGDGFLGHNFALGSTSYYFGGVYTQSQEDEKLNKWREEANLENSTYFPSETEVADPKFPQFTREKYPQLPWGAADKGIYKTDRSSVIDFDEHGDLKVLADQLVDNEAGVIPITAAKFNSSPVEEASSPLKLDPRSNTPHSFSANINATSSGGDNLDENN